MAFFPQARNVMDNCAIISNLEEQDNVDLHNAVDPLPELTGSLLMDTTPSFEAQVLAVLGNLRGDMQSMTERVNNLEATRAQSVPSSQTQSVTSDASTPQNGTSNSSTRSVALNSPTPSVTSDVCLTPELREVQTPFEQGSTTLKPGWGDRPATEEPDFSFIPVFDEEDEDENMAGVGGVKLFKISQKTEAFLREQFLYGGTKSSTKTVERQVRGPEHSVHHLSING